MRNACKRFNTSASRDGDKIPTHESVTMPDSFTNKIVGVPTTPSDAKDVSLISSTFTPILDKYCFA